MLILSVLGHRVIYDIHEDLVEDIKTKNYIPTFFRKIISSFVEIIENLIIKFSFAVVVVSPYLFKKHSKKNSRCFIVRNYPLFSEFKKVKKYSERKNNDIVYVGGINQIRGVFELMDSLGSLENVRLKIAGPFLDEKSKDIFMNHPNINKVDYLGIIERDKIVKLLNNCKIGILIGHPVKNALESLPIKLYEYMASSLPVIISNYPNWVKFINKYQCGYYVDNFNIQEISKKIFKLLSDIELSKKFGENGRKVFEKKINWKNEYISLKKIYCHE